MMSHELGDQRLSHWVADLNEAEPEDYLYCSECRNPISYENARVRLNGSHLHRFVNPAAVVYEVCCFASAPGADICGEASPQHSWFSGFSWQYAHCSDCGAHLGWYYENTSAECFFALIDGVVCR